MAINLKKVMAFIQKDVKKNFPKLKFDFELEKDKVNVQANLTVKGIDDGVSIFIHVYQSGSGYFSAMFDNIEKNLQTLTLVNQVNLDEPFFKVTIDDNDADGPDDVFLTAEHYVKAYDETPYKAITSEFLYELLDLIDNKDFKKLTDLTF